MACPAPRMHGASAVDQPPRVRPGSSLFSTHPHAHFFAIMT
ncbi:hypothetical protein BN2497_4773 [Janthinobacterium sp. CG23_2]|nr:hypothetical protein BN2497_4773 [Janthinobacterium sp. CG23_2]CUU28784.1 hypothetical protein BN3177_4773 [Janthinobacterium sp. CG23_2]